MPYDLQGLGLHAALLGWLLLKPDFNKGQVSVCNSYSVCVGLQIAWCITTEVPEFESCRGITAPYSLTGVQTD